MSGADEFRRALFAFGPHAGAHRVAVRAAVSVFVPLAVLWATGHQEWSAWAAFGSFTALYGRNRVHLSRLAMQGTAAVVMIVSVALGSLVATLDDSLWPMILAGGVVAGIVAVVSDLEDWHPPGPLFALFAFSGSASLPGVTPSVVAISVLVAAAAAGFSVLVGVAGSAVRRRRLDEEDAVPVARRPSVSPWRRVRRGIVLRHVVSVLLAGAIAAQLGIGHPYWAMVSAVVPIAAGAFIPGLARGILRIVGTTLGVLVAGALLALEPGPLLTLGLVTLFTFIAELLIGRNYGVALIAITPLALLAVNLAAPSPAGPLIVDRLVESIVGALVGIAVGFAARRWETPGRG